MSLSRGSHSPSPISVIQFHLRARRRRTRTVWGLGPLHRRSCRAPVDFRFVAKRLPVDPGQTWRRCRSPFAGRPVFRIFRPLLVLYAFLNCVCDGLCNTLATASFVSHNAPRRLEASLPLISERGLRRNESVFEKWFEDAGGDFKRRPVMKQGSLRRKKMSGWWRKPGF